MLGEPLCERPERGARVGPQNFIGSHFSEGRDGPLFKRGLNGERERSVGVFADDWHSERNNSSRCGHDRCSSFTPHYRSDIDSASFRPRRQEGHTPSGHRTPTVIVSLPLLGLDEPTVTAGGWMVQQALAQGVHGVHLARARDPEGVKRFVQAARYPIHKQAVDIVGEGLRGWGSHTFAAWVWGLSVPEYLQKADVWPLNPEGEIMLGVKLEDQQVLDRAAETLSVPGRPSASTGRVTWSCRMPAWKVGPIRRGRPRSSPSAHGAGADEGAGDVLPGQCAAGECGGAD